MLFHQIAGSGEPVVFVHGGFLDHTCWMLTLPWLTDTFMCITLDMPGHGQSPPLTEWRTAAGVADDVAELIESLGRGPVHLVGQSAGGSAALYLATRRPDLVRRVVVHEPGLVAGSFLDDVELTAEVTPFFAAFVDVIAEFRKGNNRDGIRTFLGLIGDPAVFDMLPEPMLEGMIATARSMELVPIDIPLAEQDFFRMNKATMQQVEAPVLVTTGHDSMPFMIRGSERLAPALPHGELRHIPGNHGAMFGHPETFVAAVRDFLSG